MKQVGNKFIHFMVYLSLKPCPKPLLSYVQKQERHMKISFHVIAMLRMYPRPICFRHWLAQQCNQCRAKKEANGTIFSKEAQGKS
jgi:hypothetical protein